MWRYMRKCKGLEEAAETAVAAAAGRKRKVGLEESELSTTSSVQLKTRRLDVVVTPENSENSTCESINSDQVGASCCSSNGSSELATKNSKFLDLKEEEENEVSAEFSPTTAGDSVDSSDRRETMPLSEIQAESGELESTLRPKHGSNSRRTLKMPSEAELEEFFAAAEKNMQKQFTDKYNYDIVKGEPLEGRYEWVQI